MHIVSWNVNGLRACHRKGFGDWLDRSGAEIVGVQEVRARREQLPEDLLARDGWQLAVSAAERPGYSGVALFSRRRPDELTTSLRRREFDVEGRLQLARLGRLLVANAYFPNGNGKNRDLSRIPFKLRFYRRLFNRLEREKRDGTPILVIGDFNTAHRSIDLARPKQNKKNSGFRPEERAELDRWLKRGWIDTFRHFTGDEEGHYSWWPARLDCRRRNVGWRIDYVLASPAAMPFVHRAAIHAEVEGSDHCPVSVEVDPAILEQ